MTYNFIIVLYVKLFNSNNKKINICYHCLYLDNNGISMKCIV